MYAISHFTSLNLRISLQPSSKFYPAAKFYFDLVIDSPMALLRKIRIRPATVDHEFAGEWVRWTQKGVGHSRIILDFFERKFRLQSKLIKKRKLQASMWTKAGIHFRSVLGTLAKICMISFFALLRPVYHTNGPPFCPFWWIGVLTIPLCVESDVWDS